MIEEMHIWDFPNVSVKISKDFLKKIKQKIKIQFKTQRNFYNNLNLKIPFLFFKDMFKPSYPNFIPLNILILICHILNISKYKLEEQVVSYRSSKGRTTIQFKFPIKISPLFYMTLAHIMADGTCLRIPKKMPYFSYRQYDQELLHSFVRRIKAQFGEMDINIARDRVYLPSTISMAMANKAKIGPKGFLSDRARIPKNWFNLEKENLLAVLFAFIIDEGHVDSGQIVIGLHNKELLLDLKRICKICGYDYSLKLRLYILAEGVKNLWNDYLSFKNTFPDVNLGYKERQIKEFIIRENKLQRNRKKGQTKKLILSLLKERPRTINELATILQISRQGARFHVKDMYKSQLIAKEGIAKDAAVIYKLI